MKRAIGGAAIVAVGLALPAIAAEKADLKVTRVSIFSSGVAFFEREATVSGSVDTELRFRTEQINDILKSLVVQDLGGGRVGVVSYASKDPLERTLRSFAVNLTENPSLGELLDQLRGQPVEIAGPRKMAGTIVGVEEKEVPTGEGKPPVTVAMLNVLTEEGLQQMRVDELHGLKLTNEKMASELKQALAALAGGRDTDKKSVVLKFDGQGERKVRASFLLESPIWKTSYRLVLSEDKKPFLQGWAAVENATEEDWKDVRLSLVSGRPISFRMDLYTPIYVPRPQEDLELYASLRAPEFEGGFGGGGAFVGDAPVEGRKLAGAPARRTPPQRVESRLRAGLAPAAPRPASAEPEALADTGVDLLAMGESVQSVASARDAGELFEYTIDMPVSIPRQNSAMLPIVNQEIVGEKLSVYSAQSHPKHPLHALMIENTSDLHLTQGPITIFDGNTYAGDAKLPEVKSGEKRLIAYALDLGMEVMTEGKPHPVQTVSFRIGRGVLWHKVRQVDERVYTARNKDDKARTLLIEHPYAPGWKLVDPKEPFERTENLMRLRVAVPAGKTAAQTVRMENLVDQSIVLSEVGLEAIGMFLRNTEMTPAVAEALKKVAAMRGELDDAVRRREQCERDTKETVDEQGRIRENLKTLQQNTDAYQRQLKKFDSLETRIEELRTEITRLRQTEEQKRQALAEHLSSLTVE